MAYKSVLYKKQVEAGGGKAEPMSVEAGIGKIKEFASIKSDRSYKNGKKRKGADQTVELHMHLGIDPRQADQMLRGAISLPKGIGKSQRVIAFCDGPVIDEAKNAGAIEAGADELVKKVADGWLDFDVAIAHPSMMGKVGKLGRVLGPQGKMPTPKAGTVTPEIASAVQEFSAGRMEYRNDAGGNIHLPVGKVGFPAEDLKANIDAAIAHILKIKPATTKGQYIKRVCLAATRTPSVTLEVAS
ncbi:MAG: 50S ribosomal protein L1 [Planctomycetota bacterium]|jgi:large subunit ribosomal protein L1